VFSVNVILLLARVCCVLIQYEEARERRIGRTTQLPPHGGVGSSTHECFQTGWCSDELVLVGLGRGRSAQCLVGVQMRVVDALEAKPGLCRGRP